MLVTFFLNASAFLHILELPLFLRQAPTAPRHNQQDVMILLQKKLIKFTTQRILF